MGMLDAAYGSSVASGARFLRLLADETRLRILALLSKTPDLCVCEFVPKLASPQAVSGDFGRMRRLVKLERAQRVAACSAEGRGLRVLRGRSILRPARAG